MKSEVENCHCYILTSMEIDEITPLHFAVRYFINILAKNINLVVRRLKFGAVLANCNKLNCFLFFFRNSDMQCSDKVTGIFRGTRKCRCMYVQGGINAVTVQIKATAFGHAHHNVMIVRLRFAVLLS